MSRMNLHEHQLIQRKFLMQTEKTIQRYFTLERFLLYRFVCIMTA